MQNELPPLGHRMCLISQSPQDFLGGHGKLRFFMNKKGHKIAHYFWPASNCFPDQQGKVQQHPRAIIHLVHGHGGYLCHDYLRFHQAGHLHVYEGSWVQKMNEAGFSVCGIDNQGAGRSEGLRCYCDSLDNYVEDLVDGVKRACHLDIVGFPGPALNPAAAAAAAAAAQGLSPLADLHTAVPCMGSSGYSISTRSARSALPQFIMGASMGGCLATVASLKYPTLFDGTILLAAMLSLEKVSRQGLNPYLRPVGNFLSYWFPQLPCANASKNVVFPELQLAYDADPNCWQGMTRARNAMEYIRWTGKLMAPGGMEQVETPLLIFHGLNDDVCDSDGSKALYLRACSQDKTLRLLENFWHVLTKEPGNEKVVDQIIEWVGHRSPPLLQDPPSTFVGANTSATKATAKPFPPSASQCAGGETTSVHVHAEVVSNASGADAGEGPQPVLNGHVNLSSDRSTVGAI